MSGISVTMGQPVPGVVPHVLHGSYSESSAYAGAYVLLDDTSAIAGLTFLVLLYLQFLMKVEGWSVPQPKQNVWVTLANAIKQDIMCLSVDTPEDPFSTCLVRLPVDKWPNSSPVPDLCNSPPSCVNNWGGVFTHLPQQAQEPQGLALLGSVVMDACVFFNYSYNTNPKGQNVNATLNAYRNATAWCNYVSPNFSHSMSIPVTLPAGIFLIRRDHAWGGILSCLNGGPCSLGCLMIHSKRRIRQSIHRFTSKYDDQVIFWGPGDIIAASMLAPGVASAAALKKLTKLGCWLSKQTNAMFIALSGLLPDVDSVRHATLHNRAAVDLLLLAHGHGCKDFEGMCCMNLSEHLESIHKSIDLLRQQMVKLKYESSWLERWFNTLGIAGWFRDVFKAGFVIVLIILSMLIIVPCLIQILKQLIDKALNSRERGNCGSLAS